ncbi:MAG TPA: TetR family transcriptional regulator [Streptosporangiaceae bacterium]|jgi:AcrR family transcriptional regulator
MHHDAAGSLGLRERKKRRTRQAIAAAALRLFAERGFDETTIADIAAAAEVAPRTFFSYFPSKEDVVFAEIDDRLADVRERLDRRPPGETPLATMRRVVLETMEALAAEHGQFAAARIKLMLERPALQARALQRLYDAEHELTERLQTICPALDPSDAAVVVGATVGGLQAAIMYCRTHGYEPAELNAALDRALGIMERGLASLPALTTAPENGPA